MDVAVVYESMFGNTHQIAEAIADGVRQADPAARISVLPVAQAAPAKAGAADLLIVGGPTHMWRMSTGRTRHQGLQAVEKNDGGRPAEHHLEPDAAGPGVRDWLAAMPRQRSADRTASRAAAFDTRLKHPLSGGAARAIARQLRHHGYRLAAKPAGFAVDGTEGPLREGERDRAKAWGATLASELAAVAAS